MKKITYLVLFLVIITNYGFAQWQQINGLPYNARTWSIYTRGDSLYVCNDSGLYVSPNAGQIWVKKSDIVFNAITSKDYLIAGGRNGNQKGLWKSVNGGAAWDQIGSLTDRLVLSIKCGSYFKYIGTDYGLYRVQGDALSSCYNCLPNVWAYDMIVSGSTVFAVCGRIYRSTNDGTNWIIVKDTGSFNSIATDGINIYAGSSGESYSRGVWKSSNNGNTWTRIGLSNNYVRSLAVTYNNYLIVGTNGGVYVYNGVTWFDRTQGLPVQNTAMPLVAGSNYIYAGVLSNNPEYSTWKRSISNTIDVKKISSEVPSKFELLQNYPNPFNPTTSIRYQIPKEQIVVLKIFDITGKEIETLVNEKQSPGMYEVNWNASKYSNGVYFYKLDTKDFSELKKMILVK